MTDSELKTFRRFLGQHLPEGTADMSDAEVVGMRQLMDMVGNPAAAGSLIAEIDSLLDARGSETDASLCDGSIGATFESPEQARFFLRQFRSLLAEGKRPEAEQE
jgi:hypothetical protein